MSAVVISFVDVGQGDCTVAVDDLGNGLIVDCPAGKHEAALAELRQRRCEDLRIAIATHSHMDHFGGLLDVVEALGDAFEGMIYLNHESLMAIPVLGSELPAARAKVRAIYNRLREFPGQLSPALAGTTGELGRLTWEILAPTYTDVHGALAVGNPNLASGIVRLSVFDQDVLIGGDAPVSSWETAIADIPVGAIVRWPHHGGSIGSPELAAQRRLFEITDPSVVVVSVGTTNQHGHPTASFFAATQERAVPLLCTEATSACVTGGGVGNRCAGSIRVEFIVDSEPVITVDAVDHERVIAAFGNAQCADLPKVDSSKA